MIATFILIGLTFINLGVNLTQSKNIVSSLIACAIMIVLYYYAGLFDKFL